MSAASSRGLKDCVRERVLGRLRSREISRPHALHDLSGAYAEQMSRNPTARLFVAVDPPEEVCDTLAAWARSATLSGDRRVRPNVGLRVLDPELLHVTLCFLGHRPAAEMDVLARALVACEGQACELSLGAPLWLPERNPRALAVELHDNDGRLGRMQTQVLAALREVSGWQPVGESQAARTLLGRGNAFAHTSRLRVWVALLASSSVRFHLRLRCRSYLPSYCSIAHGFHRREQATKQSPLIQSCELPLRPGYSSWSHEALSPHHFRLSDERA